MPKQLYLSVFLFLWVSHLLRAQQESQFTQFVHNQQYYNPAYSGLKKNPGIYTLYRQQWQGYPGAPQGLLLAYNGLFLGEHTGFGLLLLRQSIGISTSWTEQMSYAYELSLGRQRQLRIGIQGSMRQLEIDFSKKEVIPLEGNDPIILAGAQNTYYLSNWGSGFYYLQPGFYFGFSIPYIRTNEIRIRRREGRLQVASESRHFYIQSGFSRKIAEQTMLQVALLLKKVKNSPLNFDLNLGISFKNRIKGGVSYRFGNIQNGESIDLSFLYRIRNLEIGIAYDFLLSPLTNSSAGSIEILSRYTFEPKELPYVPSKISFLF